MLPLNPNENVFDGSLHESFSETFNLQLNGDISHNDVTEAISHLKPNKVGGPDTLIPEIFIHSAEIITPFLAGLFSQVFSSGQFPDAWTEAIIQPLHKKVTHKTLITTGGISLLNVCCKLYSYILNKGLVTWIEENGSNNIVCKVMADFVKTWFERYDVLCYTEYVSRCKGQCQMWQQFDRLLLSKGFETRGNN